MNIEWFLDRNPSDYSTLQYFHWKLWIKGLFYASRHNMDSGIYCRFIAMEQAVFCTAEDSPSTSLKAVGDALSVSHFLAQPLTWNTCLQARHLYYNACCLKSKQRMMIWANGMLLSAKLNSTLYCFNTAFAHPYSYTNSVYLGRLYLLLNFLNTLYIF